MTWHQYFAWSWKHFEMDMAVLLSILVLAAIAIGILIAFSAIKGCLRRSK